VIELATLSPLTASRFLNVFQHARRLKPVLREKVLDALEQIRAKVTPDISPTIHGQAKAYLGS
jgi:aminopeptidase N